jgi:hypothetical protein
MDDLRRVDDWEAAIKALDERGDVHLLAELLRGKSDPLRPREIREMLAELLEPQLALFNVKLVPKRTNAFAKSMQWLIEKVFPIAGAMRQELEHEPNIAEAASNVGDRLGCSKEWVLRVWGPARDRWPEYYESPHRKSGPRKARDRKPWEPPWR